MSVTWYGEQVKKQARREVAARLKPLGREMAAELRKILRVPYPPASQPGQPPRMRSGRLANGIRYFVDSSNRRVRLRIVSMAPHSGFLEHGTRNMAARPFMRYLVGMYASVRKSQAMRTLGRSRGIL